MAAPPVRQSSIEAGYEELMDAAEDLAGILAAAAANVLDLSPAVRVWLEDELETIEQRLAAMLDDSEPRAAAV